MNKEELRLVYYALADEIRLTILKLLTTNKKLCVCELQSILNISQPNLSFHLRILRDSNLVNVKKIGKWSYYSLNRENKILKANLPFIKSIEINKKIYSNSCNLA